MNTFLKIVKGFVDFSSFLAEKIFLFVVGHKIGTMTLVSMALFFFSVTSGESTAATLFFGTLFTFSLVKFFKVEKQTKALIKKGSVFLMQSLGKIFLFITKHTGIMLSGGKGFDTALFSWSLLLFGLVWLNIFEKSQAELVLMVSMLLFPASVLLFIKTRLIK